MKKTILSLFGKRTDTKLRMKHYVGFKSYENTFQETARPCECYETTLRKTSKRSA